MPRFIIERTSGDGNQVEYEASNEVEALRTVLVHSSNIAELLRDYDDTTDPNNIYHRDGESTWKHITISIGPALLKCADLGCDFEVDNHGDLCEDHQPEEENDDED